MSDIREAFRKALIKTPDPKLSMALTNADLAQDKERRAEWHARELVRMGERFERVGQSWFHLNVDPFLRTPQQVLTSTVKIGKEWQQLQTPLVNISKDERPQMISKLADGLELSEKRLNAYYRYFAVGKIFDNPLEDIQAIFSKKTRFSPASKVFFEVVNDISGYSKEQKTSFKDFMQNREDLAGLVRLPQVFPAVAEWLVQQNNTAKNT